jgi:hypothetical protein
MLNNEVHICTSNVHAPQPYATYATGGLFAGDLILQEKQSGLPVCPQAYFELGMYGIGVLHM